MFSYLIVALFALLSLSVSSRPLPRDRSSCRLPSSTPSSVYTSSPTSVPTSIPSSVPTSTPTSVPTTSPTSVPTTSPTTSPTSPTSSPSTTQVAYTTTTSSSALASTSTALTTVSNASSNGPFTGGYATYYYQGGGTGACGQQHSDSDYICAMDQTRFGTSGPSSPLCGQQVSITNPSNGKSVTVTIADDCPTCENENSIDLSVAAFQVLSDLSVGAFEMSWSYV